MKGALRFPLRDEATLALLSPSPGDGMGPMSTMNSHVRRLRTCPRMRSSFVRLDGGELTPNQAGQAGGFRIRVPSGTRGDGDVANDVPTLRDRTGTVSGDRVFFFALGQLPLGQRLSTSSEFASGRAPGR
jgi:hypothetical protein